MELFKLLGTIAIENAEAKKALQETSQEGEKTESKLGKVFSSIGKGAAVVGKTIAVGLAAGATACVGLATAAIKSYGDYEQLVGGVETLFGTRGAKSIEEYADMVGKSVKEVEAEFGMLQEAQTLVMENASNAYKTAGLSVNEYMESVNGIAAALNQSSASQLDSAELANQAVIDMSDNAAKMGTSMEAIQNAYAGFSKQNYTMLDNLKLGYGGTKEEMQRLLKDAEKISGIKYDISSFADVTQAIHVMQEEMGIAGTTAKEAAGTIQGSFGMLKGSWSNLMVGLSDPEADLQSLISNVFESVTTFAGNLIPRISQVFTGIATAFSQLVPLITGEIPGLLEQILPPIIEGAVALVEGLVAALPSVLDALLASIPALIDGVMQIVDALIGALPTIIQALLAALPTLIPQLIDGFVSMVMMLVEMLPQIIQPIIDNLPTIIISIVEALVNNLPVLIQGLIQLIMGIVTAIPQIIQALVDAIPTIVSLLVEALLTNLPAIIAGLIQVVIGIVVALPQIFASLIEGIGAVFVGIWDGIKNTFSGVGEWFSSMWQSLGNVPGLSSLKTMVENVWGAIKNNITTVINAIKNVISTVWNSIKNVISTVINAIKNVISTAWNAIKTIVSNVMKLISSVLKGDWEGVKNAISNILNAIKSVISSIWNGIKSVISSVLNGIKSVISSVWNGIKNTISSVVNGIKTIVTSVWNGIKGAISGAVNGIKTTVTTGFNDVKNKVVNAFKNLPSKLISVGKDLVKGLWKGINNATDWVIGKIKGFGDKILKGIKSFFGIASPAKSTIEVGKYLAEGVAVGITENADKAEDATEKLASNILSAAQEKLDTYKTYNDMTLTNEVAFWDAVRVQVKEGTKARLDADKKYLEAKKSLDDQVLAAEETLSNSLDEIYQKIADRKNEITESFSLFEEFTTGNEAPKSFVEMKNALDSQIKSLEAYDEEMQKLETRIGGTSLFEEFSKLGVDSLSQLQEINKMSDYQLQVYIEKYNKREELASKIANDEMADETIKATEEAYKTFSTTLEGLGLNVTDSVDGMSESVVTNFETIGQKVGSVLDTLNPKMQTFASSIAQAFETALSLVKEFYNPDSDQSPEISIKYSATDEATNVSANVDWHAKSMDNASILKNPTIFGYDNKSGKYLGGGEAGNEVVAGEQTLMNMIRSVVAEQNGTMNSWLQRLFEIISEYFPQMLGAMESPISFDANAMAGALAVPMNHELGKLSSRKDRGR